MSWNIPQGRAGRGYSDYQKELDYNEYISRQWEKFAMACWEDMEEATEPGFREFLDRVEGNDQ